MDATDAITLRQRLPARSLVGKHPQEDVVGAVFLDGFAGGAWDAETDDVVDGAGKLLETQAGEGGGQEDDFLSQERGGAGEGEVVDGRHGLVLWAEKGERELRVA
jgi:hypothetical protein